MSRQPDISDSKPIRVERRLPGEQPAASAEMA
jgi:hypothetical protein